MRASCCATAGWRSVRLKALQALGYYRSRIRTDVREGENRPVLRVRTGEPVRLRNITVRTEGRRPSFRAFASPSAACAG